MANKKPRSKFVTPAVELNYNHLMTPDMKFGAPVFQTTITMPEAEGMKMVAAMEATNKAFVGKIPYKVAGGVLTLKAKQRKYISWFDKTTGQKQEKEVNPIILIMDGDKAVPYEGDNPWGGSIGEVAVTLETTPSPQGEVVAVRLNGIRFHEVKTGGGGGNADPLFGGTPDASGPVDSPRVVDSSPEDGMDTPVEDSAEDDQPW